MTEERLLSDEEIFHLHFNTPYKMSGNRKELDAYCRGVREGSKAQDLKTASIVREELIREIEGKAINVKRNAAAVYEAHRKLKPREKQSKHHHDGFDHALQDLIDYLQSIKAQEK